MYTSYNGIHIHVPVLTLMRIIFMYLYYTIEYYICPHACTLAGMFKEFKNFLGKKCVKQLKVVGKVQSG